MTDTVNNKYGSWSTDIKGIWVAKFEASIAGSDSTTESEGRYDNTDKTLQIKPNVTSWRNITISNIYTVCKNYNATLNSHQMKNSEWGAVAYLSQSTYGKGSEIAVNECNSYITGMGPKAGSEITGGYYAYPTDSTELAQQSYTGSQGKKASTTGNVYGIYDISGGAYEYTAGYVNNSYVIQPGQPGAATSENRYETGKALIAETEMKYKQVYPQGSSDTQANNYTAASNIYGDAVYETSNAGTGMVSWYSDYSYFPYSYYPFFFHGGCGSGSVAGAFCFYYGNGAAVTSSSFRPVLVVL